MKLVKSKYRKKGLVLLLLSFGMILTNLSLSLFNSPFLNNNYEEGNIIDYDDQYILPKTSDSLPTFNAVGDKVNITLHQSYLNNSFNTIVNTSIVNGNNFTLPCPTDISFNSSYTNITIKDIIAPNKTFIVENDYSYHESLDSRIWASFEVKANCFLENVSIRLRNDGGDEDYNIRLYKSEKSTYLSTDYIKYKLTGYATLSASESVSQTSGPIWLTLNNLHEKINISETYNNTFFIAILNLNNFGEWDFESDGAEDDDSIVWDSGDNTPIDRDQMMNLYLKI